MSQQIEPGPALALPAALRERSEFTAACAERDFGTLFVLLKRYGISQVRIAAALDMTTSRVGEIIRSQRKITTIDVTERISDRLRIPGRLLGLTPRPWEQSDQDAPTDPGPTVSAAHGLEMPWTTEGTVVAAREVTEVSPMDRRSFLTMTGATLTAPAHEWLIARPAAEVTHHGGSIVEPEVMPELVDQLDATTGQLRRLDDQLGGGSLLAVVRQQTRYVIGLLENGRYTSATGRRLHGTAAELMRLGGWLSFDADHHAQAQRFFVAALHAAHTAGDRALGANILGFMSCQAKDLGHYREAVTLAETARGGYPGASPRVQAILALRAAQAHAISGDADQCHQAIGDARESFDRTPPAHGEPEWCYWLDAAQVHEQIGYCYLRLEDWTRASEHLSRAVRLQGPVSTRKSALRQALLAGAYAELNEPEHACEIGNRAVDILAGQVDSARCTGHVRRLHQRLAPHDRLPAVRALKERTRELVAARGTPA